MGIFVISDMPAEVFPIGHWGHYFYNYGSTAPVTYVCGNEVSVSSQCWFKAEIIALCCPCYYNIVIAAELFSAEK